MRTFLLSVLVLFMLQARGQSLVLSTSYPGDFKPSGLTAIPQNNSTLMLSWDAVEGAAAYRLEGGLIGSGIVTEGTTFNTFKYVSNLTPNGNYEWRVNAGCPDAATSSGFSDYSNITMPPVATPRMSQLNVNTVELNRLYPNPASAELTVELAVEESGIMDLRVTDMMGRQMISRQEWMTSGQTAIRLNTESFDNGMYLLWLNGQNHNFIIIK